MPRSGASRSGLCAGTRPETKGSKVTKQEKKTERAIDQAFKRHGNRVQIPVMKLGPLFDDVRRDVVAGLNVDTAMIDAVKRYRVAS